jgi:hypothetical protein
VRQGVRGIQPNGLVDFPLCFIEQADVEVHESELMVRLVRVRIERNDAAERCDRAVVGKMVPRLPQQQSPRQEGRVEIGIERERTFDLDEGTLLYGAVAWGDVEETLTVGAGQLGVRGGEPGIGGDGALQEVDRLRDLFGAFPPGVKSAA